MLPAQGMELKVPASRDWKGAVFAVKAKATRTAPCRSRLADPLHILCSNLHADGESKENAEEVVLPLRSL
jgi:hypothetical protein